jgi:ribonucleoside-diphosphate reductase beta chain
MTISKNILNTENTGDAYTPLFLGQSPGLYDSVNKCHPEITRLYKTMKKLDWDENEFNFGSCLTDFKTCTPSVYNAMISTIAWQWEQDTVAARSVMAILSPFITSSELHAAYSAIQYNEVVHALTYSEIVRNSFDDPALVIEDILSRKQAYARLQIVADVFEETYQLSHRYALGLAPNDQSTYNQVFKFIVALYVMERVQFMPSFAVTFAVANGGDFLPIGDAVQKICQDEFQVHVKLGQTVLDTEMRTDRGLTAFNQLRPWIMEFTAAIVKAEEQWGRVLFSNGQQITGLTEDLLNRWVQYCSDDVYRFFQIKPPSGEFIKNPIPWIDDWIDLSKRQGSPQEARGNAYFVGGVVNTLQKDVIEIDLG